MLARFVVFVVVTVNGVQPLFGESVKRGMRGASTQIVLTSVSIPQRFPVFKVIVYVPATVKIGQIVVEPWDQRFGSVNPKSFPTEPLLRVKPDAGEIDHTIAGVISHDDPLPKFSFPTDVFVIHAEVLVQIILFGNVKLATGGVET